MEEPLLELEEGAVESLQQLVVGKLGEHAAKLRDVDRLIRIRL